MVTTIILSKDRPAQLDLLLRSIERNGGGYFGTPLVIAGGSSQGLAEVYAEHQIALVYEGEPWSFEEFVRSALVGEFVCFMCDDGILYRRIPPLELDRWTDELLCVSLRYGENTVEQYPTGEVNGWEEVRETSEGLLTWPWRQAIGDFGYPGSVDAHIFRTADVVRMLEPHTFPNPTALECALVEGCFQIAASRPLMACYPHSVYVGNPVNRVSEQSNVRYGQTYPVTAAECAEKFAEGLRIDLDALNFSAVNGAHSEVELVWK